MQVGDKECPHNSWGVEAVEGEPHMDLEHIQEGEEGRWGGTGLGDIGLGDIGLGDIFGGPPYILDALLVEALFVGILQGWGLGALMLSHLEGVGGPLGDYLLHMLPLCTFVGGSIPPSCSLRIHAAPCIHCICYMDCIYHRDYNSFPHIQIPPLC